MVETTDIHGPKPVEVDVTIGLSFSVPYRHLPTLMASLLGTLPLTVSVEMEVREP